MKKLDQWYMSWLPSDGYKAPEQRQKLICGLVDGREAYIAVTPEALNGRIITLANGDQIELGAREPGYAAYMEQYRIPYDEANPIKLVQEWSSIPDAPRPSGGGRTQR